jgi:hypothetical protein
MPPSATAGSTGDYEVRGRIRYLGCDVITRAVKDAGGESRSAPEPADADGYEALTIRFAGSDRGNDAWFQVTVIDAQGRESSTIQRTVHLE